MGIAVVGMLEGRDDGDVDGSAVGATVVGFGLGLAEGSRVGAEDGFAVGADVVGMLDGAAVGNTLGSDVGADVLAAHDAAHGRSAKVLAGQSAHAFATRHATNKKRSRSLSSPLARTLHAIAAPVQAVAVDPLCD